MIFTEDLSKKFEDFTAVEGVNLTVGRGEVLALLGPNGAGKTTTVRMLTSVLKPTRGTARVAGFDVVREAPQVRAAVGVLTEHHGLYHRMPAAEYLDFFGRVYGMARGAREQRAKQLLGEFGLASEAERRIGEFSKGMRQKLALARAMFHKPAVLLLDEPTSAMDPESARLVRDAISELRSAERAIVICTHNLVEAEELADRIAIIRRGKIIAHGGASELKQQLLGPAEYEVRFSEALNGRRPRLPGRVALTTNGEDWLRFRSDDPQGMNPMVTQALVEQGFLVVSVQEVARSLEQVYLQALTAVNEGETSDVG